MARQRQDIQACPGNRYISCCASGPENLMMSSSPALWARCLNGGGQLFNIVPGQVFDRHAGGARQPERVDQALHAPLVDPVIDGLARYPADGRCRTRPACQPDRRSNEIGLAYPGSPHGCSPLVFLHVSTFRRRSGRLQTGKSQESDRTVCYERHTLLQNHGRRKTINAGQLWELCGILRLRLMSLRVDTKAKQSYLTSRLKEVQIGHENHA